VNPRYGVFLHDSGFHENRNGIKLFVFSDLFFQRTTITQERDALYLVEDSGKFYFSSPVQDIIDCFIGNLFPGKVFFVNQKRLNFQTEFVITSIKPVPEPAFSSEMTFSTVSPIIINHDERDGLPNTYISPSHTYYVDLVLSNLLKKYKATTGFDYFPVPYFSLTPLTEPKSRLSAVKDTRIRGFHFTFKLKAPIELMKIAYDCGIGISNSMGFGMIEPAFIKKTGDISQTP
jgi:CRISPR-associated endoribonuclease Cas6